MFGCMNKSVKDRTIEFVKFKGITMKSFEMKCGLSTGYVTSMRKGFGTDKLNNVLKAFPELNRDWLLYGEGEMLSGSVTQSNHHGDNIHGTSVTVNKTEKEYLDIIRRQSEQLSKSQQQIDRLLSIIESQKQ